MDPGEHLHFLELCAGSHRLTDVALEFGMRALAMDASHLQLVLIVNLILNGEVANRYFDSLILQ